MNIRYFHTVTAQRKRINRIERLESYERQQIEGENELGEEITNYFGNLFTTSSPNDREKTMVGMRRSITDAMNAELTMLVDEKEITKAIFSMNPHKAPGPNGITPFFFFQKYWSIIKNDVCMAIIAFFESECMLSALYHTLITLIPKIKMLLKFLIIDQLVYVI